MNPMTPRMKPSKHAASAFPMLRLFKSLGWLAAVLMTAQVAPGFSLLGPIANAGDAYQTDTLSYNLPGDIGAPKNLGEEYRLNTPQNYYACDSTFLDYFGSNGLWAVDQAFAAFNSLSNVSSYSADLSEFPLDSQRLNYTAQALRLLDLKSTVMSYIIEHMGLAESDRWTWALRARISTPVQCLFEYHVIQRNFDPITWEPTRYVNGARYTYYITDGCPVVQQADAVEVLVDPLTSQYSAVASWGLGEGGFYSTLTRDDMGGLRYLYRANNMNVEQPPAASLLYQTNLNPQLIYGSNLTLLAEQALTNDAPALAALYPGLLILGTTNYFVNTYITNITTYVTNFPWAPAGSSNIVYVTNLTPTVQTRYRHSFGNIEVVRFVNGQWTTIPVTDITTLQGTSLVQIRTITLTVPPWSPVPGTLVTNTETVTFYTNRVVGEFFILPTNSCALSIIAAQLTNVVVNTNIFYQNTNLVYTTNFDGSSNITSQVISQEWVDYFISHVFVINNVECVTNNAELRQGIEKVSYIRRDYDSLLGRFFVPITNDYSMTAMIRNQPVKQYFRRVVLAPDILIQAQDLDLLALVRSINFGASNLLSTLAGPGTIEPFSTLSLNKIGPTRVNIGFGGFEDETTAILTNFVWGSFDGSTNPPVVYPIGTSIRDLEDRIFIDVQPPASRLPNGRVGVDYGDFFEGLSVTGGQPPYTWSSVGPLPAGLYLSPYGDEDQRVGIYGTPVSAGLKQFVIRLTDAGGRYVDVPYTVLIVQ
jgi:hypothetical protein